MISRKFTVKIRKLGVQDDTCYCLIFNCLKVSCMTLLPVVS